MSSLTAGESYCYLLESSFTWDNGREVRDNVALWNIK